MRRQVKEHKYIDTCFSVSNDTAFDAVCEKHWASETQVCGEFREAC